MKKLTILATIITTIWVGVLIWCITLGIKFDQNCSGYLQQAADANTIELAIDRLDKAIEYAEEKGYTDGYTSILWKTENENVGFWYQNLKSSRIELEEALDANQMEQTNVLMKLRETLLDVGEKGTFITYPTGLYIYPYNLEFSFLLWFINLLVIGIWIYWFFKYMNY